MEYSLTSPKELLINDDDYFIMEEIGLDFDFGTFVAGDSGGDYQDDCDNVFSNAKLSTVSDYCNNSCDFWDDKKITKNINNSNCNNDDDWGVIRHYNRHHLDTNKMVNLE